MDIQKRTEVIRAEVKQLGFASVGIAPAEFLDPEAYRLEKWLKRNLYGQMEYLPKHFDLRVDPKKLLPEARSVIMLACNYFPEETYLKNTAFRISRYALGRDYHKVLRGKLKKLEKRLCDSIGSIGYRSFVDSAPVMEKAWAARCGIGWIGKSGNLIVPNAGSYFFLGGLFVDLELEYDQPHQNHCGNCRQCIDACPTDAIVEPYLLDCSRCISYLTIEHRGSLPPELQKMFGGWIFGCDICQEVCPFNRFSKPHREHDFLPRGEFEKMSDADWRRMSEAEYNRLFEGSAVKRARYERLMRNIEFTEKNIAKDDHR